MLWLLAIPVLVIIWATLIERFLFIIKKETIPALPEGSKPITILHLSDIHMAPWQRAKQRWLSQLAQRTKPDLVINTGDNLGHHGGIDPVLNSLAALKIPGVFVNGSNDFYAPVITNPFSYLLHPSKRHRDDDPKSKLDTARLNAGFEKLGWLSVNNRAETIEINNTKISFLGTDDPHEGRDNLMELAKSAKSLSQSNIRIGITHAPYLKVLDGLVDLGAEAIFAGHTHGGQVCWPFIGRALVTNCDLPTKYARGAHKISRNGKSFWLNVCAGLGNSIYAPVRLACRPEVRLITLVSRG